MNPSQWRISTLAGSKEGYVDGKLEESKFAAPSSFAFSPSGFLYVADRMNKAIRKVDVAGGKVSTVARNGLEQPVFIIWSPLGYFVVVDRSRHRLFKLDEEGNLSTLCGSEAGCLDGERDVSKFSEPSAACALPDGTLLVSDSGNARIRMVSNDVKTYAGSRSGFLDGILEKALFSRPWGICLSSFGELFICDWGNNRIRVIDMLNRTVKTVAGQMKNGNENGLGLSQALFDCPIAITTTPHNKLLVADRNNHRLRLLSRPENQKKTNSELVSSATSTNEEQQWTVSTFSGSDAGLVDGNCATEAKFVHPICFAWNSNGALLVSSNNCIRVAELSMPDHQSNQTSNLSTSLGILLENGDFSDFQFSSVSGRQWKLHKAIILCRCISMAEDSVLAKLNSLAVQDGAWQAFFEFLYFDRLPSVLDVTPEAMPSLASVYCDLSLIANATRSVTLEGHSKRKIKDLNAPILELISALPERHIESTHPTFYYLLDLLLDSLGHDLSQVTATIGEIFSGNFEFQHSALQYVASSVQPHSNQIPSTSSSIASTSSTTSSSSSSRGDDFKKQKIQTQISHQGEVSGLESQRRGDVISSLVAPNLQHMPHGLRSMATERISPRGALFAQLQNMASFAPSYDPSSLYGVTNLHSTNPWAPFDYEIRIGKEVSIPVHKCILFARWPFFRFLINSGTSESTRGFAEFPGIDDSEDTKEKLSPRAFYALIWFFYSDSPSLFTFETSLQLLSVSGLYRLTDWQEKTENQEEMPNPGFEHLIDYCRLLQGSIPTHSNAVQLHKLALKYENETILKKTKMTIISNLGAIFRSKELKEEFETLELQEKYNLMEEAFERAVKDATI